jgi:hypothetical protein
MTARRPCPPTLRTLEDYATHIGPAFHSLKQRHPSAFVMIPFWKLVIGPIRSLR